MKKTQSPLLFYIVPYSIFLIALVVVYLYAAKMTYAIETPIVTTTRNFDRETGVVCYTVTMISSTQFDVSNSCPVVANSPNYGNQTLYQPKEMWSNK
jgi:hypothetical protein